ncbi:MAG: hypothetical protein ACLFPA_10200 [Dichotomicrobium sp.]
MNRARWGIRWWHIAAALALTALLDLYELAVTIPELAEFADGPIFDTRVGGYSSGEAVRLLTALGSEGRWYYLTRHLTADTVLALIEAAAIILIILRVTRPGARFAVPVPPKWRMALLAAPVLTLIFDLGENALVAGMLVDAAPSATQVALASLFTQAKWVFASVSIALAIVLPLTAWRRGRKHRAGQPQQPSPH